MLSPDILTKLQKRSPHLAQVFLEFWNTPLAEYAGKLYQKKSSSLEPELIESFEEEWEAMGLSPEFVSRATQQFQNQSVLQTAHHITPTNGPTFLSLDLISLAGLRQDDIYLVAANSGVPFSNSAWTGALSYGELPLNTLLQEEGSAYRQALKSARERSQHGDSDLRVTLIPARQRDQLVFGSQISSFQLDLYNQWTELIQVKLPLMREGELYSHWAAKTCGKIQSKLFDGPEFCYFDINQVLKRYLVKVLEKADHPVSQLFYKEHSIWKAFGAPTAFLASHKGKKSYKVDNLHWNENGLTSKKKGFQAYSREQLLEAIQQGQLCPGLFLMFFILRFLNGIRCLGSFNQIEYLENFRKTWLELGVDWPLDLESDWQNMLTTGRLLVGGKAQWPLDLYINEQTLDIQEFATRPMKEFWTPIMQQLTP